MEQLEAPGASVVAPATSLNGTSVAISFWNSSYMSNVTVSDGENTLMSDMHGVTLVSAGTKVEVDDVEDPSQGFELTVVVVADSDTSTTNVRKAVSCRYFNRITSTWSRRGMCVACAHNPLPLAKAVLHTEELLLCTGT